MSPGHANANALKAFNDLAVGARSLTTHTNERAAERFAGRHFRRAEHATRHDGDGRESGDTAQALLTIRDGVASQFRGALEKSKGRNRVTIIQALGVLQDKASAATLKKALKDEDRHVRRTAAWALANTGEASAADALIKSSDSAEGWERTEATRACLLLAERLAAANQKPQAARIYAHLRDTRKDPTERHVRDAAERALSAIPTDRR